MGPRSRRWRTQREQGKLATLEAARPAALSDRERQALVRLAGDLPRVWVAPMTTDRDRKGLLRTLISEVIVTAYRDERRAAVEVHREGGAQTELGVALRVPGKLARDRIAEDTLDLIHRLAEHHPHRQIAGILGRQDRLIATGLPFTETRVRGARKRAGIPAAAPADADGELFTIKRAASELGVSVHTIRRWINTGLLPAQQTTPARRGGSGRPTRSARGVPDVPAGYVPLNEPRPSSAAPDRPCCTRSNAAS